MKHLSQEEKKIRREEIKKIWVKESVKCYKMLTKVGEVYMYEEQSRLRSWRERELKRLES